MKISQIWTKGSFATVIIMCRKISPNLRNFLTREYLLFYSNQYVRSLEKPNFYCVWHFRLEAQPDHLLPGCLCRLRSRTSDAVAHDKNTVGLRAKVQQLILLHHDVTEFVIVRYTTQNKRSFSNFPVSFPIYNQADSPSEMLLLFFSVQFAKLYINGHNFES